MAIGATLIVATATAPAPAEADTGYHVRLILVRTTTGPASIDYISGIGSGTGPGFYGLVMARVQGGVVKSVQPGDQQSYAEDDDPGVYAGPQQVTLCQTLGECNNPRTAAGIATFNASDDGGNGVNNVVFIALDGQSAESVNYTLELSGWQVKQVPFGSRHVDGTDPSAGAVAVSSAYGGAELFTDADAPGGPQGSIAQAAPPCGSFPTNGAVPIGAGQLTLSGGVDGPSITCPVTAKWGTIADYSASPTTWNAHGTVVGQRTLAPTRLWVVDLPTTPDWYRPN